MNHGAKEFRPLDCAHSETGGAGGGVRNQGLFDIGAFREANVVDLGVGRS
jgi:hypothetical protein